MKVLGPWCSRARGLAPSLGLSLSNSCPTLGAVGCDQRPVKSTGSGIYKIQSRQTAKGRGSGSGSRPAPHGGRENGTDDVPEQREGEREFHYREVLKAAGNGH